MQSFFNTPDLPQFITISLSTEKKKKKRKQTRANPKSQIINRAHSCRNQPSPTADTQTTPRPSDGEATEQTWHLSQDLEAQFSSNRGVLLSEARCTPYWESSCSGPFHSTKSQPRLSRYPTASESRPRRAFGCLGTFSFSLLTVTHTTFVRRGPCTHVAAQSGDLRRWQVRRIWSRHSRQFRPLQDELSGRP